MASQAQHEIQTDLIYFIKTCCIVHNSLVHIIQKNKSVCLLASSLRFLLIIMILLKTLYPFSGITPTFQSNQFSMDNIKPRPKKTILSLSLISQMQDYIKVLNPKDGLWSCEAPRHQFFGDPPKFIDFNYIIGKHSNSV